jgi:hypothetical protein
MMCIRKILKMKRKIWKVTLRSHLIVFASTLNSRANQKAMMQTNDGLKVTQVTPIREFPKHLFMEKAASSFAGNIQNFKEPRQP